MGGLILIATYVAKKEPPFGAVVLYAIGGNIEATPNVWRECLERYSKCGVWFQWHDGRCRALILTARFGCGFFPAR